jgi:hypothetical protein
MKRTDYELEADFMSINTPKSARERWAWNEIQRLRDRSEYGRNKSEIMKQAAIRIYDSISDILDQDDLDNFTAQNNKDLVILEI